MKAPEILAVLVRFWNELRASRRLQWGLAAVVAILVVEGGIRWSDHLAARSREIRSLEAELVTLRSQVRSEPALRQSLGALAEVRGSVESRLWNVPSEAVGQARLKEWLEDTLRKAGAAGANLNLSGVRSPGGEEKVEAGAVRLREFRATLRFTFAPMALEKMLAEIEAGDILASVESLTVNRRERRVEMTVRVLMQVAGGKPGGGA